MMARTEGAVVSIVAERPGCQEITVKVGETVRDAMVYPSITGPVAVGDTVILNTWAMELGLGTGGVDFVAAVIGAPTEDQPSGHVMKARYTPAQVPVLACEAPESPYHEPLTAFVGLDASPVVCAELLSQVPAIAAAAKWETRGEARIVYVMTDGAALPMGFSRLVPAMRSAGLLDAVITAGQAFGGDYEAVNVYSALAVARLAARADIIIVCQGPGNTGTETPLGFSGIDQGIALNAAVSLDGTPIAAARLSFADPRPRHVGLSHHTRTVLQRVALCSALVPLPRLPQAQAASLRRMLDESGLLHRHEFMTVQAEPGLEALLDSGIEVTTMGRSIAEERPFFLAAAAAGLVAGQWFTGTKDNWTPVRPRTKTLASLGAAVGASYDPPAPAASTREWRP
jgi:hypothetical protein